MAMVQRQLYHCKDNSGKTLIHIRLKNKYFFPKKKLYLPYDPGHPEIQTQEMKAQPHTDTYEWPQELMCNS